MDKKYRILIKTTGYSKDLFKFYINDSGNIYETSDITELTAMYNKLVQIMPMDQVIPIHFLNVELNTIIEDCI